MRDRYQRGSLELRLKGGRPTWVFRWSESTESGKKRRAVEVGTFDQFPTKALAYAGAERLRLKANVRLINVPIECFQSVVDRYIEEEIPQRFSTQKAYLCYLRNYVSPQWGKSGLKEITPLAVTNWLRGLELAGKSKSHLRGLMHILFDCAMFWGLLPIERNPMDLVRLKQSTKREREPRILTQEEFHSLLQKIEEPFRTMVLLDMCLGLRCSELMALKWSDFDWEKLTVMVQRSIVNGRVDEVKTRYSRAAVPLDPSIGEIMLQWMRKSEFSSDSDWVFASPHTAGELPYCSKGIQRWKISPAAKQAGIGRLGWHDLRHTYRSWLSLTGAPMAVQKDLMRHSSIQTTMNIYGASLSEEKRSANSKVVRMAMTSGM